MNEGNHKYKFSINRDMLRIGSQITVGKRIYLISTNKELYDVLNDINVVQRINIQWLCCLGHAVPIHFGEFRYGN